RGRELRAAATAAISLALCMLRSVPLGKYWRSSPLVFSLVPRCHGCKDRRNRLARARLDLEARLLGHLSSLIPSQRPAQLLGQCDDRARDGVTYRLGAMTGEGGPVLHGRLVAMARHARQVQQKSEAR